MAAKSKKRLSKIENKLLKLDKLELKDVFCSICHSILIEPVTLPCFHAFCHNCFNGSIENNALCCPLCRLRIGSWLRTATKQKNLVNVELWNYIKSKFSYEIATKTKGEDVVIPEEKPITRLSAPGEIRQEYELELKRLQAERLQLEQKQYQETELLIKKIQEEEEEAHRKYLEALKQDEILAQQMQSENPKSSAPQSTNKRQNLRCSTIKPQLRVAKIDEFLSKKQITACKNTDRSTPIASTAKATNHTSPELVPSYGKLLKNLIDKKIKAGPGLWNKENGVKEMKDTVTGHKCTDTTDSKISKNKNGIQSLLVSLPLPCAGILQHKTNIGENKNLETDSVDSMRQELCYFKPIEGTTPTSFNSSKGLPVRVPGLRLDRETDEMQYEVPPSRAQYLEGLCRLRNLSLAKNLPSAFVIALNLLQVKKEVPAKCTNTRSKMKRTPNSRVVPTLPQKKSTSSRNKQNTIDGINKLNTETNLRRTRSMGSITKEDNETTPKKAKLNYRKACSDRKPYLRSDSKKSTKKEPNSPPLIPEALNNNKVTLAVKNLSSPLKNCDVKKIVQEQLRIEKIIEQEKNDYEFACKVQAEWNGRRAPRRAAVKRQVSINYALRPAKKLKV
ncbi:E3 ubiquitin-protein ligase RNF169-like isoform X2 [Ostrinia furnacalis]|uniref:E3 ubiquitin-protein ligase RNF169-like isoform X2 n=1 Tax=Ostrinia furnacalis TaxID=93504 RepID=UPI0010391F2D|nr:E3 ubiquitin-protein ligase RNF169-like isoform X2 [Ostrinia furnacalis]